VNDLRLLGLSDDGNALALESEDGTVYTLQINDHLRDSLDIRDGGHGGSDSSSPRAIHLAQITSIDSQGETQPVVTVKEIQARLRAGESIELIAQSTDWTPEKIEKFSGPIMQERAYIIGLALEVPILKEKNSPTLSEATILQLEPRGVDLTAVEWNAWREPVGIWSVILSYPNKDGAINEARWHFDVENRSLTTQDDGSAWISGEALTTRPSTSAHGIVPQPSNPAPRLVAVKNAEEDRALSVEEEPASPAHALDTIIDSGPSTTAEVANTSERHRITKRLKIPSWDEIMFGGAKETEEPNEPSEEE
jgi:Protein of unknown function (DUF3071)